MKKVDKLKQEIEKHEKELQENELRIGNIVHDSTGNRLIIESIPQHNYKLFGIPITEDMLLKMGWRYYNGRTSGDMTMDTNCKIDLDYVNGKICVKGHYEGFDTYRKLPIQFIHQLQNLYFALNGTELEV